MQTLESISFLNHKDSVNLPITASFALQMTLQQFSPFKCVGKPKLTLPKKGQGHPRVMIYTNFNDASCQVSKS